jgi:hypothetical protein
MEPLNEDLSDEVLMQIEIAVKGQNEDDPAKSVQTSFHD